MSENYWDIGVVGEGEIPVSMSRLKDDRYLIKIGETKAILDSVPLGYFVIEYLKDQPEGYRKLILETLKTKE